MARTSSQTSTHVSNASRINGRAVLEAGLIAGVVFLMLEFITGIVGAATSLGPATFTLQTALNVGAEPPSAGLVTAAMFLHFTLSLLTTLVLGFIIHRWARHYAIVAGLLYGAFLYSGNVVLFIVIEPELGLVNDTLMLVNYAIYGTAAAWLYKRRQAAS
jgi:membrane-bound ClpP family serine protease